MRQYLPEKAWRANGSRSVTKLTLQSALPQDLVAKFERNRRGAEAKVAQAAAERAESAASASLDAKVCRPVITMRKGSKRLEDLDDRNLLALQLTSQGTAPPSATARGHRSATDDALLLLPRRAPSADARERDQGGRQMYDKRTLRRRQSGPFLGSIHAWRQQHSAPGGTKPKSRACLVFVRARPIFEKEAHEGEFEVVSIYEEWGEVVVHNCLFHMDLVRMYVHHSGFVFPRSFDATASNEDVYAECGRPLVEHCTGTSSSDAPTQAGLGTLFMFGQTGSGKTFTMRAIMEHATRDIFRTLSARRGVDASSAHAQLKVFEIAGKKVFDLLTKQRSELRVMDDHTGRANVIGAIEIQTQSAEDCVRAIRDALARRATAGHARNDESSRSHCVCIIDLPGCGGSLVLVDCAGTERRQDSDQHSSERIRESAEINASLHALKECIRYRGKEHRAAARCNAGEDMDKTTVHVPYRGSMLTRILAESFTRPGSLLAAIGTISPTASDTEHTLSTLKTLQLLANEKAASDAPSFEEKADVDPRAALWQTAPARFPDSRQPNSSLPRPQAYATEGRTMQSPPTSPSLAPVAPPSSPSCREWRRTFGEEAEKNPCDRAASKPRRGLEDAHDRAQTPPGSKVAAAHDLIKSWEDTGSPKNSRPLAPATRLTEAIMAVQNPSEPGAVGSSSSSSPYMRNSGPPSIVKEPAPPDLVPAPLVGLRSSLAERHHRLPVALAEQVNARDAAAEVADYAQRLDDLGRAAGSLSEQLAMALRRAEAAEVRATMLEKVTDPTLGDRLADALHRAERAEAAEARVVDVEARNMELQDMLTREQRIRRKTHNQLLDLRGQIRVFVRVRPTLARDDGDEIVVSQKDLMTVDVARNATSADGRDRSERKAFSFDAAFGPRATQEEVFGDVKDLVQSAVDGYNISIFAYGQTGAGKTHTMYGGTGEAAGIIPRTAQAVFDAAKRIDVHRHDFLIRVQLVELYRNDLLDLLGSKGGGKLTIHMGPKGTVLEHVEERSVRTPEALLQLLREGSERRHTGATRLNADSSRSHLVLTLAVDTVDRETGLPACSGKIQLCDLAGSERPKKSGADGDVMKEAIEINKSLSALGDVIEALTSGAGRRPAPYRNHKLTQLLADSIGGTAKTVIFVNVAPTRADVEESVSSLSYAARARGIRNTPPQGDGRRSRVVTEDACTELDQSW